MRLGMEGKNKKKGKILEKSYEWLWDFIEKKNSVVTSPKYYIDKVTGQQREIDVYIEKFNEDGEQIETIMVECRNRNRVEDVTWVEQVVTKKNDLEIDRAIMVTTSSFTEPAKRKANHYEIELERSSPLTSNFIEEKKKDLNGTIHFAFMECTSINVTTDKGKYNHDYLDKFTDVKNYVKSFINDYSERTLVNHIWQAHNEYPDFFKDINNSLEIKQSLTPKKSSFIFINLTKDSIDKIGELKKITFIIKIKPIIISFPITRFITIFDDEKIKIKSNKRHKSEYENEEFRLVFQFHKDELLFNITLKKSFKYCKFIEFNYTVYALLDNIDPNKTSFKLNNHHPEDFKGEIYFDTIWKN